MVRRDGAEVRKERIQEIARLIHRSLQRNGEICLSKTLSLIQYEFGLTRDKIREYIGILEGLGQFLIETEHDKIKKITEG
jgi:hypothetical protein